MQIYAVKNASSQFNIFKEIEKNRIWEEGIKGI